MAALLAGQAVSAVAKEYDIPEGTVKGWMSKSTRTDMVATVPTAKKEAIGDLLIEYLTANIQALRAQAELFSDKEWLRKQSAENAAVLHGVMTDKAVRLIEALSKRDDEQEATDAAP
jgi:transposase-like protein